MSMNYAESVVYLYSLGHEMRAMKFGLEAIGILSEAMGSPHRSYSVVHIAGTNGKGSTSAMVERIAREAGLRTALYTSPHLISVTERLQIDGIPIEEEDFARIASLVRETAERLVEEKKLPAIPTFFEQVTMIAYQYFAEQRVDLAVLEVGMGGRLDATNICAPIVTAITPVGLDHQQYLGDTLAEIAGEKAGIIKPGVPIVVASQPAEAFVVIAARAAQLGAPLIAIGKEIERGAVEVRAEAATASPREPGKLRIGYRSPIDAYELCVNLPGRHQAINALTAIRIVEELRAKGFSIHREAVAAGLAKVTWPGRLEWIAIPNAGLQVLLDGAHNAAGAVALRDFLQEHIGPRFLTMIFGAMGDKAISEMGALLFPQADRLIVTRVKNIRAADPGQIAAQAGRDVICRDSAGVALEEAVRITPSGGVICACGSLFLVGEVRQALGERAWDRKTSG
jgi:dihydrofolate synthase/folylpolyglutamate synthase